MANYHEYAVREVTDPEAIGVGVGDAPDGSVRVCISLEGTPINPGLAPEWQGINWASLTPACARTLFEALEVTRHLWERKEPPPVDEVDSNEGAH